MCLGTVESRLTRGGKRRLSRWPTSASLGEVADGRHLCFRVNAERTRTRVAQRDIAGARLAVSVEVTLLALRALIAPLPLLVRHAVDALAGGRLAQLKSKLLDRLAVHATDSCGRSRRAQFGRLLYVAALAWARRGGGRQPPLARCARAGRPRLGCGVVHGGRGYSPLGASRPLCVVASFSAGPARGPSRACAHSQGRARRQGKQANATMRAGSVRPRCVTGHLAFSRDRTRSPYVFGAGDPYLVPSAPGGGVASPHSRGKELISLQVGSGATPGWAPGSGDRAFAPTRLQVSFVPWGAAGGRP
jgi:hypothetical protein